METTVGSIGQRVALAATRIHALSSFGAIVGTGWFITSLTPPAEMARAHAVAIAISVHVAIVRARHRSERITELPSHWIDGCEFVRARAHIWHKTCPISPNAVLRAIRFLAGFARISNKAITALGLVIASTVVGATEWALKFETSGTEELLRALAHSRNRARSMLEAPCWAHRNAAINPSPPNLTSAVAIDALPTSIAFLVVDVETPTLFTGRSVEVLGALADSRQDTLSDAAAVGRAVRFSTRFSFPASGTPTESVHLAVSMVVAVILANAQTTISSSPSWLTFALSLHTLAVLAAVVNAHQSLALHWSSAVVANPSLSAIAQRGVNALSVTGAIIKTHRRTATWSFPTTEACANVWLGASAVLAIQTRHD